MLVLSSPAFASSLRKMRAALRALALKRKAWMPKRMVNFGSSKRKAPKIFGRSFSVFRVMVVSFLVVVVVFHCFSHEVAEVQGAHVLLG
jgi:hypothetical protein